MLHTEKENVFDFNPLTWAYFHLDCYNAIFSFYFLKYSQFLFLSVIIKKFASDLCT